MPTFWLLREANEGATLAHWWDGTLGKTLVGNNVSVWEDQVGGIEFSQVTDANRAEYIPSEYSLKFTESGATNYTTLTAPTNIPAPYSLVVCFKRGADNTTFPSATVRIVIRNNTAHGLSKYSYVATPAFNTGTAGTQATGVTEDGNYHVVIRTFDSDGNSYVYRDNSQVDSDPGVSDYSGPTGDVLHLGGLQNSGAGNFWIRHVLIYSGVLLASQRAQLQTDLMPEQMDPPIITTTSLPNGTQGEAYSQQLAATGDGTITWAVTLGDLPGGMTLSSTGLLSSADVTESGAFAFTVTASSEWGSDPQDYILQIDEAPPAGIPVFVGPDIGAQAWDTDEVISLDVSSKWTGQTSYALVEPWPLGITINGSGVISGTAPATEFSHPRCCVKAINANGETISNFFDVTVTDPTPETNNLLHNSRFMFSDPAQDDVGPWGWNLSGMSGATLVRTHIPSNGGYELDITCNASWNNHLASQSLYGFTAGTKYTIMADCEADSGNDATQLPFVLTPGGGGYTAHSSASFHQVAAGVTKRAFLCFSHTSNVSRTIQLYVRRTSAANRLKIKNVQLVEGEYLTLESLPTYAPTGPSSDGTYITIRDLGTVGRSVPATHFGFDGLWWGMPDSVYNINLALANANNKYYSPRPESPRLEAGLIKIWGRWSTCEVSDGVFDWTALDSLGRRANKLAQVCNVFGLPFYMVVDLTPPLFRPAWRPNPSTGYGRLVKDFTKMDALIDAMLEEFVPLGCVGLELNGEPSGDFWGERDTSPSTTAEWRDAARVYAVLAKRIRDRINVYNAANNKTIRLFGPGDTSNFNNAQRFSNPGYSPEHGTGFLDGSDGVGGIGIDHIDGISFHGYYSWVDTGMRVLKTIDQVQKWAKNLGRPDIALWCSEGLGKEVPLTSFATSSFATQCKFMLGVQGALMTFDSVGYSHYAWDHNGAGFYGSIANPPSPPEADHTEYWVANYETLEPKWNALKTLVTTGGNKVYACRVRESDTVIEILVGTTRAGATWYAMDETFTGA